jgi:hypothetical protein
LRNDCDHHHHHHIQYVEEDAKALAIVVGELGHCAQPHEVGTDTLSHFLEYFPLFYLILFISSRIKNSLTLRSPHDK